MPTRLVLSLLVAALVACGGPSPGRHPVNGGGAGGDGGAGEGGAGGPGGTGGGAEGGSGGEVIGGCDLRVPGTLDVGPVPVGLVPGAHLVLANAGGAACAIDAVTLDGCGDEFALALPGDRAVPAGGTLAIPVTLAPEGDAEVACTLRVLAGDDEHVVALAGHRDPECLIIGPPTVRFAPVPVACGLEADEVRVWNRCGVELTLTAATVAGPAGFAVDEDVPLPLPPGASEWLRVVWSPEVAGPNHGELRLGFAPEGVAPAVVELVGDAPATPLVVDRFEMPGRPKVDVLFVIDNGVAMEPFAQSVRNNLKPFLSFTQAQEVDYRIAVTTTGLTAEPDAGCPGGVDGGEDGRFFPVAGTSARILTPATPGLEAAWQAAFEVGTCRTGVSTPLEAALRALTPPLSDHADDPRHPEADDGNAGFLREDAHLSVWFITSRKDESPRTPNWYYNAIQALKGFRNTHLFNAHAITGDEGTGCSGDGASAERGDKLVELVEKTEGGIFVSICSPNWETAFREMSVGAVTRYPTTWFLSYPPADLDENGVITDGELAVRVNGHDTPSIGPQGQRIWQYRQEVNALSFFPLAVPEPGSVIEVEYERACP